MVNQIKINDNLKLSNDYSSPKITLTNNIITLRVVVVSLKVTTQKSNSRGRS